MASKTSNVDSVSAPWSVGEQEPHDIVNELASCSSAVGRNSCALVLITIHNYIPYRLVAIHYSCLLSSLNASSFARPRAASDWASRLTPHAVGIALRAQLGNLERLIIQQLPFLAVGHLEPFLGLV